MTEEKQGIQVQQDLTQIKPVEGRSVDLRKYDRQVVKIEKAELTQVPSKFTEKIQGGEIRYMQWVLKVSSVVLETIGEGEEVINFRTSELFNMIQDKDKLVGFPTSEGSNLMKFCKDIGIKNPEKIENLQKLIDEIKGKNASVKYYEKEVDGKKKSYLKFRY